jgi:anthraniloyl-CoA monooxygenase
MAVGNIYEPDHVNSILAAGRADLCALARPHLADPNWTPARRGRTGPWRGSMPPRSSIAAGFVQLARNMARASQMLTMNV